MPEATLIRTFIGRVLATRNAAHIAHWKSRSLSQHLALDEFYSGILMKLDEIVEAYQGRFGLIGDIQMPTAPIADISTHIAAEYEWIRSGHATITGGDDTIGNLVDEICAVYLRTTYKLRFLA